MQKGPTEVTRHNYSSFCACLAVFTVLAVDGGFRLAKLLSQRRQLDEAQITQAQNMGRMEQMISQQAQYETWLQALSIDLLQIARTNNTARQIVQDFNIQWNPGPNAAPPAAK